MSRMQTFTLLLLPSLLVLALLIGVAARHFGLMQAHTPEELRESLRTGNEDARYYAAIFLGQARDRAAAPALIEALRGDASHRVRARAAYALGLLKEPSAIPALIENLEHPQEEVLNNAAWALGELDARAATPALEKLLAHPNERVRWNVAVALARLGSAQSAPLLREMAASLDKPTAIDAVRALALAGTPADVALLRALPDRGWGAEWSREVDEAAAALAKDTGGKR